MSDVEAAGTSDIDLDPGPMERLFIEESGWI